MHAFFPPRPHSFALGLVLLALAALPVHAENPDPAKLAAIRSRMQTFVDDGEIAGAVTLVGNKDRILSLETVGSRSLAPKAPMPKDAVFKIASMTKPITAMGIMILADEGKLSVDDPVEKYLPEFKGQMLVAGKTADTITLRKPPRPITLRDLLTHTSGLPGSPPPGLSDLYSKRNHTLAEGVMAFSQRPLDFEPGSKWSYCNTGIDTLGRVIEVVSGKSYEDFLRERIFEPLGMKDTTFYPTDAQLERLATMYDRKDGKLVAAGHPLIGVVKGAKYPIPAGGLLSTADDLAKLYQMTLNHGTLGKTRILSPESLAAMTKVQTGDLQAGFTPGMSWGLGFGVVREPTGVTAMLSPGTYGHGGAFGTQAWIDPEKGVYIVLLIQRVGLPNSDASKMREEFQKAAVEALKR